MKNEKITNKKGKRLFSFFFLLFSFFSFISLSCQNPVVAGLGPLVDTRPPTVTLLTPGAGSSIWSANRLFTGSAEDDYRLDWIKLRVTNQPNVSYLNDWVKLEDIGGTVAKNKLGNQYKWKVPIDTTQFPDGDLMIQFWVCDTYKKEALTEEIAFYIRNDRPVINLTSPYIAQAEEYNSPQPHEPAVCNGIGEGHENCGKVGGPHLNYGVANSFNDESFRNFPRGLDSGAFLTGSIRHADGIYRGAAGDGRYPPQFRLWQVSDDDSAIPVIGDRTWKPGAVPTEEELPWDKNVFTFNDYDADAALYMVGLNNYQFTIKLPEASGVFYGFEVRAQNEDGRTSFHYPRDYWNAEEWDAENSYVLFFIRAQQAPPSANIWGLEDITVKGENWNDAKNSYNTIIENGVELNDNINHPYINKPSTNKNGDFTLRVWAAHSQGISKAEVYWEKTGTEERGRLIWDYQWDDDEEANIGSDYTSWGFRDPHSLENGYYQKSSFIFTYKHGYPTRIPDEEKFDNSGVRGRYKIQRYRSPNPADAQLWSNGKRTGIWSRANASGALVNDIWESFPASLEDGVYTFEVYASSFGSRMTSPYLCTMRLDTGKPVVELNTVDGAYSVLTPNRYDTSGMAAVVNGVMRARFRFKDAEVDEKGQPTLDNSGLRTAVQAYYESGEEPNKYFELERRYLLVQDEGQLDSAISYGNNWWPKVPDSALDDPNTVNWGDELSSVKVFKHGPIVNSAAQFKTSPIYPKNLNNLGYPYNTDETDVLIPGTYYLYVFARDNAFNVGSYKLPIIVEPETDRPDFDFSIGEIGNVTDPNIDADGTPNGFRDADGNVRNKLAEGSTIRLRLTDDDSLDLGTAMEDSTVKISFVGSYLDGDDITPYTDSTYIRTIDSTVVKTIFAPRVDENGARLLPIKERDGSITTPMLLDLLKHGGEYNTWFTNKNPEDGKGDYDPDDYTNILPDGMYQITINVNDYNKDKEVKLIIEGAYGDDEAYVVTGTANFWVAVDTKPPVITNVLPPAGGARGFIAPNTPVTGTVSDANGPITPKRFEVYKMNDENEPVNVTAQFAGPITIPRDESITGTWQGNFTAPLSLTEEDDGRYNIIIELEDRFRNYSRLDLWYILDTDAPAVSLDQEILNFERIYEDVVNADGSVIPFTDKGEDNRGWLTNGIVDFIMTAADVNPVTEARWWLLHKDTHHDLDWDGHLDITDPANPVLIPGLAGKGIFGRVPPESPSYRNQRFFIDTTSTTSPLPDGEYHLYVGAKDQAGNAAVLDLQTVYILQIEDKPYFDDISPASPIIYANNAVDMVLRGAILEDDGFTAANGTIITEIKIWANSDINHPENINFDIYDDAELTARGYKGPLTIPAINMERRGKDIDLKNFNLVNNFVGANFVDFLTDGTKHYIIEAKDSLANKYIDINGTRGADILDATRRKHFFFDVDGTAPVIEVDTDLDQLPSGQYFVGPATTNFNLEGYIQDTFLEPLNAELISDLRDQRTPPLTDADIGKYYFWYDLDNTGRKVYAWEATEGNNLLVINPSTGVKTASFNIDPSEWMDMLNLDSLLDGPHTVYFTVRDKSGKEGYTTLNFYYDKTPPKYAFTNIDNTDDDRKDLREFGNWWSDPDYAGDVQSWFQAKHDWAWEQNLTVIQYRPNGVPFISGTFNDDGSDIDTSTFKYWIDGNTTEMTTAPNGARLTGNGRNYNWTVYLTTDGTNDNNSAKRLPEGVHSIRFTIADDKGNTLFPNNTSPMFAFRINSSPPQINWPVKPADRVYGDRDLIINNVTNVVIPDINSISPGAASSMNLADIELVIRYVPHINQPDYVSYKWDLYARTDNIDTPNLPDVTTWYFDDGSNGGDGSPLFPVEKIEWHPSITRRMLYAAAKATPDSPDITTLTNGDYELAVVSRDLYGQKSDELVWEFTIDTTQPNFEFNGMNTSASADRTPVDLPPEERNVIMSSNPRILGIINDEFSNLTKVDRQILKFNYDDNTWSAYRFSGGTVGWTTGANFDGSDFWQAIVLPLAKEARLSWDLKNLDTNAEGNFPDGLYRVQLRSRDSALVNANSTLWTPGNDGNPRYSDYVYFYYALNAPGNEHTSSANVRLFSSRIIREDIDNGIPRYGLNFTGTATGENRFESFTIKLGATEITGPNTPRPGLNGSVGYGGTSWNWEAVVVFDPALYADGSYRLEFTITDWAGRSKTINRDISLDNTPPDLTIQQPQNDLTGGQDAEISGFVTDPGREASGPSEIWYHLGYLGATANSGAALPEKTAIIQTVLGAGVTEDIGGNASFNALFDTAAKAADNGWFKYVADAGKTGAGFEDNFAVPPGFDPLKSTLNINVEGWNLLFRNTSGNNITNYAEPIKLKTGDTVNYNDPDEVNSKWLVQKKDGRYSLPLWIRVTDKAGNAAYYPKELIIDPYGDYPSSKFVGVEQDTIEGESAPRGGTGIVFDGQAKDNTNVSNIIYRVKVDNMRDNNKDYSVNAAWKTQAPPDEQVYGGVTRSNIVTYNSATPWNNGQADYTAMEQVWDAHNITTSGHITKNGWYRAEHDPLYTPNLPWGIMPNINDELRTFMDTHGFNDESQARLMRVFIEVFVFDGNTTGIPESGYNKISLNGGDPEDLVLNPPKPYTMAFYVKEKAPFIELPTKISAKTNDLSLGALIDYHTAIFNDRLRSNQFRLQAVLDGMAEISQISVQLSSEVDANWRIIYSTNVDDVVRPQTGAQLDWNPDPERPPNERVTLTYSFDSTITAAEENSTDGFSSIRNGEWAKSGGKYTVSMRVRDGSGGESMTTFVVGIDNYAPVADTTTVVTNPRVAGSNVNFLGRVFDYHGAFDNPRPADSADRMMGLSRVYAWFTKKGKDAQQNDIDIYVNMKGENAATTTTVSASRSVYNGRNAVVTYDNERVTNVGEPTAIGDWLSLSYPQPGGPNGNVTETSTEWVKVLSLENAQSTASSESGIGWDVTGPLSWEVMWRFTQNSTDLPDGWIYLNYIIVDQVGNATYYQQSTLVTNKPPRITDIVLYTNNTPDESGTGATFTTHDTNQAFSEYSNLDERTYAGYTEGYLNSGFIVKNTVVGFGVKTALNANYPLHYRLDYVMRYQVPLTAANLAVMKKAANGDKTGSLATTTGVALNMAADNVLNLYTISAIEYISVPEWQLFGLKDTEARSGMHFTFDKSADISKITNDYPDTVWAYKRMLNSQDHMVLDVDLNPQTGDELRAMAQDTLNFYGNDHFEGASKINEAHGSHPDDLPRNNSGSISYYDSSGGYVQADAEAAAAGTAFFLIKVYDTVDNEESRGQTGFDEDDMLFDAVVVGMNVYIRDTNPPVSRLYDLSPYLEDYTTAEEAAAPYNIGDNILRGGLYQVGTTREPVKSGYIDPRPGSDAVMPWITPVPFTTDTRGWIQDYALGYVNGDAPRAGDFYHDGSSDNNRDKVSGTVILRGLAWDDQLIREIRLKIGDDAERVIVRRDDPQNNGGTAMVVPAGVPAYAYSELHWQTGHTVEWAYVWDTSVEPALVGATARPQQTPLEGVTISVTVVDMLGAQVAPYAGTPNANIPVDGRSPGANVYHNTVDIDIVPYVTGIVRAAQYETTRSRQGWYSFFKGEEGVSVWGLNLGAAAGNIAIDLRSGPSSAVTLPMTGFNTTNSRYSFNIPTGAESGAIEVRYVVNGANIYAYNKDTNVAQSWNSEKNANRYSDLWNNKPHAHIWDTDENNTNALQKTIGGSGSANPQSPAMDLEYTSGKLHGAWVNYSSYSYGDNTGNSTVKGSGRSYTGVDINLKNGTDPYMIAVYEQPRNSRGIEISENNGAPTTKSVSGTIPNATSTTAYVNPRIRARPGAGADFNGDGYYVTYADQRNKELVFGYINSDSDKQNFRDDGNPSGGSAVATRELTTFSNHGYIMVQPRLVSIAPTSRAGVYQEVDYDDIGPIIAFQDLDNDSVCIAFGLKASPTLSRWRVNDLSTYAYQGDIPTRHLFPMRDNGTGSNSTYINDAGGSGAAESLRTFYHPLARDTGQYISMKVDKNGGIHLAFLKVPENTLFYGYLKDRDALNPNTTEDANPGTSNGDLPSDTARIDYERAGDTAFQNRSKLVELIFNSKAVKTTNTAVHQTNQYYIPSSASNSEYVLYAHAIDTVVLTGFRADITVDENNNPMIVYGNINRFGNVDAVRIAYQLHDDSLNSTTLNGFTKRDKPANAVAFTGAVKDQLTGMNVVGWEALNMPTPASHRVNDDRLNIAVWPPNRRATDAPAGSNPGWDAAVGYASDKFRVGYFKYPQYKGY